MTKSLIQIIIIFYYTRLYNQIYVFPAMKCKDTSGLLSCDSSLMEVKQLDQLWSKVAGTEIRLESLYWPPFERKTSKTIFSWKFKRSGFDMDISSSTVTQLSGRNPAVLQCRHQVERGVSLYPSLARTSMSNSAKISAVFFYFLLLRCYKVR